MDGGFRDFAAFIVAKVIEDEIEVGLHFFKPDTLLEVILKTAVLPTSEIRGINGSAVFAKFSNNVFVRKTVVEHVVDGFTKMLGKSGDFAFSTMRRSTLGRRVHMRRYSVFSLRTGIRIGGVSDKKMFFRKLVQFSAIW